MVASVDYGWGSHYIAASRNLVSEDRNYGKTSWNIRDYMFHHCVNECMVIACVDDVVLAGVGVEV
ncbi:hypothetical protein D3C81_1364310 [compost metagenome]